MSKHGDEQPVSRIKMGLCDGCVALAEKDKQLAAANEQVLQLRSTIRTLTNDNDRQAKEIDRLKESMRDQVDNRLAFSALYGWDLKQGIAREKALADENSALKARIEALEKAMEAIHCKLYTQNPEITETEIEGIVMAALNPQQETSKCKTSRF